VRRWPEGCLFPRGCGRDSMVQGKTGRAKEGSSQEEDSG
jgi:hypothetical protein